MFGMAGTWGSDTKLDTKLVWNPYESTARSVQALELKLGSLVLLLLVTLLCAFIPLWLFRRPGSALNSGSFVGPTDPSGPWLATAWPPSTHVHVDFNAHSAIRLVVLFLALSLHSIFEGLAVGLQDDGTQALEICLALLIHKGAIAFSLSLKLLQGRLRPRVVAICLVIFSAMSPFGIGLGVALTEVPMAALSRLSRSVLEGLATGTFIYITFLEILPHELGSSEQRILKVIVLLLGFALVTSVLFVKI
ncbi:hypothetical protein E2320_013936 [Naja naja]|nr:hypothetical protein E2320_013936 [Naja naja]